jgi:hypothetical protein
MLKNKTQISVDAANALNCSTIIHSISLQSLHSRTKIPFGKRINLPSGNFSQFSTVSVNFFLYSSS